jgi:penicillin G amidase
VVELDPKGVKAWGVYPGGQAGNPGSPYYAQFVERWQQAQPYPLYFMANATEQNARIRVRQRLKP